MKIFDYLEEYDYEQLIFCHDKKSGLKAIIGIHDTTMGPALGGTRIWDYQSEDDAIMDVLRLSKGMTYKNAAAGLNFGGGKTVIMGDPKKIKSEGLFRALGRYIEGLNGRYITAEDVNTTTEDMDYIHQETDYVVGLEGKSGNPSPVTAFGVFRGILAAVNSVYGSEDLNGKTIAVQGLGSVGYELCRLLKEAGANLVVTALSKSSIDRVVNEIGAKAVAPDEIYGVECDVFSPCALGAIINDFTIDKLKCKIIAGAANNQLKDKKHGDILHERNILYVPDYIINSGGVINVYEEFVGYNKEKALEKASKIYYVVEEIIQISKKDNIPTYLAADKLAEDRIEKSGRLGQIYLKK